MGVKKWKTEKRETVANFWEITAIMAYFDKAETGEADEDPVMAIRDRALYGLMLFTGCRPDEARAPHSMRVCPSDRWGTGINERP
jgi:integrase